MKRGLYLVLVCLLNTVLVLSSCAKDVTETPPITKIETNQITTPTLSETPTQISTPTGTSGLPPTPSTTLRLTPTSLPPVTTIVTISRPLPPLDAFMKGFNFADWAPFDTPGPQPLYNPAQTDVSLKNLAATGTNWIALFVRGCQDTISSTNITRNQYATASDSSLQYVVDFAHTLGVRVMLKPHVHLSQDPTHWHGQIGTTFTNEAQWQAWFTSYREFIVPYAKLAQDAGADMFCIGQEMTGTVQREADWRRIAQEIRQVYKGAIIYEATVDGNPSISEELMVKWWDAVDYIGVLGYFPLTQSNNPTVEDLKLAWVQKGYLSRLENLSQKFKKLIIISEIGYESKDGTNITPANFTRVAPVDLQEQADCYQAAFGGLMGQTMAKRNLLVAVDGYPTAKQPK